MRIPKTIAIGGHEIKVIRKPDLIDHAEAYGLFDKTELAIYLDESLEGSLAWETFWHEVIEAINHFAEADMEHKTIQTFGLLLHQVFVSGFPTKTTNPKGKGDK